MDRAFQQVSRSLTQQGRQQERVLGQLGRQQGQLLASFSRMSHAMKVPSTSGLEGMGKMLDRQWQMALRLFRTTKPSSAPPVKAASPPVRVVISPAPPVQRRSELSPALLKRFDDLTEAVRKMRPRTYGIMR